MAERTRYERRQLMGRIDKTVFISYRRTSAPWALAIFQDLTHHGYDVFFDFNGIASGDFESVILENIHARAHFLVLLTPTALERCSDPRDWLRREIEAAIDSRRNIVPVLLDNFDFANAETSGQLSGRLGILRKYNGLPVPLAYFAEAMTRLRERYLNVPLDVVLQPASEIAQHAADAQRTEALIAMGDQTMPVGIQSPEPQPPQEQNYPLEAEPPTVATSQDDRALSELDRLVLQTLQGAWTDTQTGSWFHVRVVEGRLLIPYCYHSNNELTGHIYDVTLHSDGLRGTFEWLKGSRMKGAVLLSCGSFFSSVADDVLQGGWWYTEDSAQSPDHLPLNTPNMHPLNLHRVRDVQCPEWAEEYFRRSERGQDQI